MALTYVRKRAVNVANCSNSNMFLISPRCNRFENGLGAGIYQDLLGKQMNNVLMRWDLLSSTIYVKILNKVIPDKLCFSSFCTVSNSFRLECYEA